MKNKITIKVNGGHDAELDVTPLLTLGASMNNHPIMCFAKLTMHKGEVCCKCDDDMIITGIKFIPSEYVIDTPENRDTFQMLIEGRGLKAAGEAIKTHRF